MAEKNRQPQPRTARNRALPRGVLLGALGLAAAAIAAIVVVLVLFVFGGEGDGDRDEIEALARRSVEALPAGEWPLLYDSFTTDFHERCSNDEFVQAGLESAANLGDDLPFLTFSRIEDVAIQEANARAVIVGQAPSTGEFRVLALFKQEDGQWKLAPASGTEGCQAFRQQ